MARKLLILASREPIPDRLLVDRNGVIEPLNVPPNRYLSPRFSPDGRRLAVQTDNEDGSTIWIYELSEDTQIRPLAGEGNNRHPIWTPDGERVTFASDRDGTWNTYWQPADGSGVAEPLLMVEDESYKTPESWSSDGQTLTIHKEASLWTMSLDDQATLELFYDAASDQLGSSFSPDGQWIAYTDAQKGPNIYIQPFPPTGVRPQITQQGGAMPMWSPDGDELFYRTQAQAGIGGGANALARLMAINITTDPALRWTNERVLPIEGFVTVSAYRDYDITPDGEQFLMVFSAEQSESGEPVRPQINIVLNWFEELKERVPVP